MRVVYSPTNENWLELFADQVRQSGHGIQGFHGAAYQRGGGLGNFLGKLFRFILPVAKTVGKAVGKQALTTGVEIAGDLAQGENFKKSAKKRLRKGVGQLAAKGKKHIRGHGQLGKRPRKKSIKGGVNVKKRKFNNNVDKYVKTH